MTIELPHDVESGILAAVRSGRFASVEAAMTAAACLLLEQLRQPQAGSPAAAGDAQQPRPIWEEIQDLTVDVPDEEWDKLPTDLAEQHDHYLYGTPKRPAS
jgi:hypothetical protein